MRYGGCQCWGFEGSRRCRGRWTRSRFTEVFERWNIGRARRPIRLHRRYVLLVCIAYVGLEGFEFSQQLTFIQNGRASVFDKRSRHIFGDKLLVPVESPVQILRDTLRALCQNHLVLVGLEHAHEHSSRRLVASYAHLFHLLQGFIDFL